MKTKEQIFREQYKKFSKQGHGVNWAKIEDVIDSPNFDLVLACMQKNESQYLKILKELKSPLDRPTPPVGAKTAEEILFDTCKVTLEYVEHWRKSLSFKVDVTDALLAMEAYHAQFTPSTKSVEVEEANTTAQDQAIINVDNMPNIHKQLPEKAYIFGFIDGSNWQEQKQAETISRLRDILEELANINSTSQYHQELRVKAFGILNPTPTNKDTQNR